MQTNTCQFRKAVNLAYGQGGLKLEINIPPQHILAKSKGGLIIKGGVSSSEYGIEVLKSHTQAVKKVWVDLFTIFKILSYLTLSRILRQNNDSS